MEGEPGKSNQGIGYQDIGEDYEEYLHDMWDLDGERAMNMAATLARETEQMRREIARDEAGELQPDPRG